MVHSEPAAPAGLPKPGDRSPALLVAKWSALQGVHLQTVAVCARRQAPALHVPHDGGLLPRVLQREGAQRVGGAQLLLPPRGAQLLYVVR